MPPKRPLEFCYEYERPSATADAVVWTFGESGWRILLIKRKSDPFAGRWALPGGFVNPNEPPIEASIRELKEETSVSASDMREVGSFGDKGRDPRGWTISSAYYTLLPEGSVKARAGDDASRTSWHEMSALPELAFDHDKIIEAAKRRLAVDLYTTAIAKPLLPDSFTSREVGRVFRTLDPRAPRTGDAVIKRLASFGVVTMTSSLKWRFAKS